ncbi:MAG: hypothetical protein ACXVDW_03860 [Bacteroidia bacterium]
MKKNKSSKRTIKTAIVFAAAGVALFIACGPHPTPVIEPSYLPQDVKKSCVLPQQDFNSWFESGSPSENGLVKAANSVKFIHNNNCDFYKWSEQMFLWITSPAASGNYKTGNTVMETPLFYTVTPSVSGHRSLIPHKAGEPLRAVSHISQLGPDKLPVIIDKKGNLFEVEKQDEKSKQKLTVLNEGGKEVEVKNIETDANGVHTFIDNSGKAINQPKPLLKHISKATKIVREFKSNGKSFFLDSNGQVVDAEQGQATGDALIAEKNGSLLYYITMVNDVYAQFLTATNNHQMSGSQFPTTDKDRDSICSFARNSGVTLLDSNALAIELKTSWVETTNLPDAGSYITIDAIVPTYNKTNPNQWIVNGEKKTKLALLGVHIVGSASDHPEMVWATFEHEKNAPNASYQYVDSANVVKTVPADTGSNWLLSSNAADPNPNISHIKLSDTGDTLNAAPNQTINASNTLRRDAWGSIDSIPPNAEDGNTAAANSEVISINNDIRKMLVGKDLRKNYLLIGATWTNSGVGPNGYSYPNPDPSTNTNTNDAIGTSQLANSTMETYLQDHKFFNANNSCFRCHSNNDSLTPGSLSHVFSEIGALNAIREKKEKKKK